MLATATLAGKKGLEDFDPTKDGEKAVEAHKNGTAFKFKTFGKKTMNKKKSPKRWEGNVSSALDVINSAAKKQKYDATHTADGKKLKKDLKVFVLEDPAILWSISEIDEKIYKRKVTLESKGQEPIKRYPTGLFIGQKKAVDACIKDIKQAEKVILREMRESLSRLDAVNRIKNLDKLKNL